MLLFQIGKLIKTLDFLYFCDREKPQNKVDGEWERKNYLHSFALMKNENLFIEKARKKILYKRFFKS